MSEHVELLMDPDGYWGGVERDWVVAFTRAPRRPLYAGWQRRIERETTGYVVVWVDKYLAKASLSDEVIVATSDDGERRVEWNGGRRCRK